MQEEIVRGRSLEEIRKEWASKLGISPDTLEIEILDKPGVFSRQWKVKLRWTDSLAESEPEAEEQGTIQVRAVWQDGKYSLDCPEGLAEIVPFPAAGTLFYRGAEKEEPFFVSAGDVVELAPYTDSGRLTWQLEVRGQGLSAVAKISKRVPGKYGLLPEIETGSRLELEKWVYFTETPPGGEPSKSNDLAGEFWDEARLDSDLRGLRVVYGRRPEAWAEILAAADGEVVTLAEAKLPVNPQPSRVENMVEIQLKEVDDEERVDFFASKIHLVEEGALLARKIPGRPGEQGMDVYGRAIPVPAWKDFQFRLKKNVHLSEDGLEVFASCAGRPVRFDDYTYGVDNVYVLNQNVDLASGSIEFPGDVLVNGNVLDGLRIVAEGKVEIRGEVSHAEIRAEKGVKIHRPVLGGKIVVGEKHVVHSEILRHLKELREELHLLLRQTAEFIALPNAANLKPGQCLKLIMERNFPELPKKAVKAEQFFLAHRDELITEELILSVRAAKRFTTGLGPLEPSALQLLTKVDMALDTLVGNISLEVPKALKCEVEYIQGTTIESGGDFSCSKGVYNSDIRTAGDVEILGVCRGGKITAGGNVSIYELGGSEVSSTFVQITGNKRLKVEYCHPNVVIAVNKEVICIEEAYKKLEVYRERGKLEVEKLRANPL